MKLFKNILGKKKEDNSLSTELYNEKEINLLEGHIKEYFGDFETVFHEMVSPDIHVDIVIIPPSETKDYYTLITMGMGAHKMNVPKEIEQYNLERSELVIYLPKDWRINDRKEEFYWPLHLLKTIARLPISNDTWVGFGHTISNEGPFSENTKLYGTLLLNACGIKEGVRRLKISNKEYINFYQLYPLYKEEMDYKLENGSDKLIELFDEKEFSYVININRKNVAN